MTKLTFDVDFTKDPEEILQEIQERAKAEVAKRESKIKSAAFLSNLHEKVNQEIGTDFKTANDLIRALTAYANPKLRDKISSTSPTGRRITVSMNRELYEEIRSKLAKPNSNKAAIARETGASVVQVRKVASGGFDEKFSATEKVDRRKTNEGKTTEKAQPEIAAPEPPLLTPPLVESEKASVIDSTPSRPEASLNVPAPLPEPPALPEATNKIEQEDPAPNLPPITPLPPAVEEISDETIVPLAPPPASSLGLLPTPSLPEPPAAIEATDQIELDNAAPDLPPIAPPSPGTETSDESTPLAPPPAPSLDLPPTPSLPEPPAPIEATDQIELDNAAPDLPPIAPPSMGTEISDGPTPLAPPPVPSLDLPPTPSLPEPTASIEVNDELEQNIAAPELPPIAPPSMGTEISGEPTPLAPPPAPSIELPPSPTPPEPSPVEGDTSTEPSPTSSLAPKKTSLSLKSKGTKLGIGAKKGKPTLSLKPGKKKPGGLKITRPPMKPPSA